MIKGLGVYLKAEYGEYSIEDCFTDSYWTGTKLWKWEEKKGTFDTPESRQMRANVFRDPNMQLMKHFEDEEEAEKARVTEGDLNPSEEDAKNRLINLSEKGGEDQEKKKAKKSKASDKDDDSEEERKWKRKKQMQKLKERQDPDLIPQLPKGTDIIQEIDTTEQNDCSVASSITMDSEKKEISNISDEIKTKDSVVGKSDRSATSIKTMNTKFFENLLRGNEDMSDEEIAKIAKQHIQHAASKYAIQAQRNFELQMNAKLKEKRHTQLPKADINTKSTRSKDGREE